MDNRERQPAGREGPGEIRSLQDLEAVINEGLRASLSEEVPDRSLEVLLEHLGKALNGDRTYIFERNEYGCDDNTYEWVADGVEPEKENLQNVPPEVCASWYRQFSVGRHIVIRNLEDVRETDPLQYETLRRQDIGSLVVVPLYDGERIIGFYGVDNPPAKLLEYASNMLQTAAYFIVSSLRRRDLFRELRRQYRQEARRSLEDILEGARTGIWTIELEEGCPPRMYADRTMRILLGVPEGIGPEECYRRWFDNIQPEYVGMVREAVEEILTTGRSEVIYPWNHPQLGRIYVRCGGVPDRTFKKPGACLNGYHQDITDTMVTRKKQEQSIMELLERVRQANSAKSEFLSRMSHDLRTPINGILGMLSILERTQGDPARQADCRRKIRVSAEHLLSLVNDVLQVSKLESGRPAAVEEPFDLRETLETCAMILSPQAEEREVDLGLDTAALVHSRVVGSSLHLRQILMNVMDNAIRFNRPGGSVGANYLGVNSGTSTWHLNGYLSTQKLAQLATLEVRAQDAVAKGYKDTDGNYTHVSDQYTETVGELTKKVESYTEEQSTYSSKVTEYQEKSTEYQEKKDSWTERKEDNLLATEDLKAEAKSYTPGTDVENPITNPTPATLPDWNPALGEFGGVTLNVPIRPDVGIDNPDPRPTTPPPTEEEEDDDDGPGTTTITEDPTPLAEAPEEVEIPPEEVPLAEEPEEDEVEIPDEDVPLADVPQTGDIASVWYLSALVAMAGLVVLTLVERKVRRTGK